MWDSGVKFFFGIFFMPVRGHLTVPPSRGCAPGYDRGAFQAPEVAPSRRRRCAPLRGAADRTSPTPSVTAYRRDISPSLSILAREGERTF